MTRALLVVDVQGDYLSNEKLTPSAETVIAKVSAVLENFRYNKLPVAHIRTAVSPGEVEAMPHRRKAPRCVLGTPGYDSPTALQAHPGELVAHKQHFRGFTDPALDVFLSENSVNEVVIVGLYTHACIRETTLDAYERGLRVWLPIDALGTDAPSHAAETLDWIGKRAATLTTVSEVFEQNSSDLVDADDALDLGDISNAAKDWAGSSLSKRSEILNTWASSISDLRDEFAEAIHLEVKKSLKLAASEVDRTIAHINSAIGLLNSLNAPEQISDNIEVYRQPLGVIAALMPWNNPLALPVSKIAPAVATGNGVVFKPSPLAEKVATLLMTSLRKSGMPNDLVRLVFGGAEISKKIARDNRVNAVTITGSISAGRQIAMVCAARNIPLQSELGGNNAAIIWARNSAEQVAEILNNALIYSGQRCTAPRRIIVPTTQLAEVQKSVLEFLEGFELDSQVIDESNATRIENEIKKALDEGAVLVHGGTADVPTVLIATDSQNSAVQTESFGPVVVIQPAENLDTAITLANKVEQGLVLFYITDDIEAKAQIEREANVGIIQNGLGPLPVHADAPFSGWKASGNSSPEHGHWDLDFFTKVQARYRV